MASPIILQKYRVTDEQIDKAHRVEDLNKHQIFYTVESAHDQGVEYRVFWNPLMHRIECNCLAGQDGQCCWHARASLAHADELMQERRAEQERDMAELQQEIDAEAKAHSSFTVQEDETSCSLDGQNWERRDGKNIPMR
jgi:hypothetical protein